ncbi:hypothetical protein HY933_00885 [Candidatus Falkowbacteria bacterium]|nr:hypothetical protein [Candidatus Falkowbacteria bacterium]
MGLKNQKLLVFFVSAFFVLMFFYFSAGSASAQVTTEDLGLNQVADTIILPQQDIRLIIANIIRIALGLIGIVSVGIILYGGFVWMTSGGEEEKIQQAKKIMINWAIGLAIILLAFAIVTFIMHTLGITGLSGFNAPGNQNIGFGRGALGSGIVESHYPTRGQHDVPRNTMIMVTFKEPIDLDVTSLGSARQSFILDPAPVPGSPEVIRGVLNAENVRIFANSEGDRNGWGLDGGTNANRVVRVSTTDAKTFVIDPVDWLGSPSEKMYYSVRLGENIKKANGDDAFGSGALAFYLWDFEVSTQVDTTPPQVESVFPLAASTEYMNAVVQINFNEPINPIVINNQNIAAYQVTAPGDDPSQYAAVAGQWTVSNNYSTIEFTTDSLCGLNSCGEEIYCLPGNAELAAVVRAASLDPAAPADMSAQANMDLLDGVMDAAANSLNGNGQNGADCSADGLLCPADASAADHCGCAVGPSDDLVGPLTFKDNFVWRFSTNSNIISSPPVLESFDPGESLPERSNVELAAPAEGIFGRRMLGRTLTSANDNVSMATDNCLVVDGQCLGSYQEQDFFWFTVNFKNFDDNGQFKTRVYLNHQPYQETIAADTPFIYSTQFTAGVKDIYQNCYQPAAGPGCTGTSRSCCVAGSPQATTGLCPQPLPVNWVPNVCGNGSCELGESTSSCPADCLP